MPPESQGNTPPQGAQDTDPSKGSGGDDAPKYVTSEELNRIISSRLGDFQRKQEKTLNESHSSLLSKLDETLTSKFETFKPAAPPPPETKKGEALPAPKLEELPEWKASQNQIAALTKDAAESKARAAQAEARRLDSELRSKVVDQLQKSGFDNARAKIAVGHLVDSAKVIGYDDDGKIVFRAEDGDQDLAVGLKAWLKTDEGRALTPARGASGSGDGPRGQGAQGNNNAGSDKDPKALFRRGIASLLNRE